MKLMIESAYGRTYNTKEEVIADMKRELDFRIFRGSYFSIRDLESLKKDGVTSFLYIGYDTSFHITEIF